MVYFVKLLKASHRWPTHKLLYYLYIGMIIPQVLNMEKTDHMKGHVQDSIDKYLGYKQPLGMPCFNSGLKEKLSAS